MRGSAQSPTDCANAVQALGAGDRNADLWAFLHRCGVAGATALGNAISSSYQETDVAYLQALHSSAGLIRDPEILNAATEVVRYSPSSRQARAAALITVARQLNEALARDPRVSWSLLMTGTPTMCPVGAGGFIGYSSTRQLSADSVATVSQALDQLSGEASAPTALREMARCVRRRLADIVPITFETGLLRVTHQCGNYWRFDNYSDRPARVRYEVVGTGEVGELSIRPQEHQTISVDTNNSVRLLYNGVLIMTAGNGWNPCP